jgi:hypothetical protein
VIVRLYCNLIGIYFAVNEGRVHEGNVFVKSQVIAVATGVASPVIAVVSCRYVTEYVKPEAAGGTANERLYAFSVLGCSTLGAPTKSIGVRIKVRYTGTSETISGAIPPTPYARDIGTVVVFVVEN